MIVKTAIVLDVLVGVVEGVQVLQLQPFSVSGRQFAPVHKVLECFAPSIPRRPSRRWCEINLPSVRVIPLPEGLGGSGEPRGTLTMLTRFYLVHMKRVGSRLPICSD